MSLVLTDVISTFTVHDLEAAHNFYEKVLGLTVERRLDVGLMVTLPTGRRFFMYAKTVKHEPSSHNIMSFPVDDIDGTVDELVRRGVKIERYDNEALPQDERGVYRGLAHNDSPDIAWFKDPSGNILSIETKKWPDR